MSYKVIIIINIVLLSYGCKEMPEPDDINTIEESELVKGVSVNPKTTIENDAMMEKSEIKPRSFLEQRRALEKKGFQVMEIVDDLTNDTILMQQYFMAFLKKGPVRNQNEEESKRLQDEHLRHLSKMYELGYADISGPFGDDGDIRGITIYNVPTFAMADSLANADPMVRAKRLEIEMHPWWGMKSAKLR